MAAFVIGLSQGSYFFSYKQTNISIAVIIGFAWTKRLKTEIRTEIDAMIEQGGGG